MQEAKRRDTLAAEADKVAPEVKAKAAPEVMEWPRRREGLPAARRRGGQEAVGPGTEPSPRARKAKRRSLEETKATEADNQRRTGKGKSRARQGRSAKRRGSAGAAATVMSAAPSTSAAGELVEGKAKMTLDLESIEESIKSSRGVAFKCSHPGCDKAFQWKWSLDAHVRTHLGEQGRVYKCQFCQKGFFTVGCLRSHVRIHTRKAGSLSCNEQGCNKSYSTSEGLRLHIRNHHAVDKKWVCSVEGCGRSFVRQTDLRLHLIRIHSPNRPFPCTFAGCPKSFACYSELKRHLNCHNKAKRRRKSLGGDESDGASVSASITNRVSSASIDSASSLASLGSAMSEATPLPPPPPLPSAMATVGADIYLEVLHASSKPRAALTSTPAAATAASPTVAEIATEPTPGAEILAAQALMAVGQSAPVPAPDSSKRPGKKQVQPRLKQEQEQQRRQHERLGKKQEQEQEQEQQQQQEHQ